MKLKDLLQGIDSQIPEAAASREIISIHSDSRCVTENSLFVALKGKNHDGNDFIGQAVEKGAVAVIVEGAPPAGIAKNVYVKGVPDARSVLGDLARCFYGDPSKKLKVVGVTGTNGKTTITYLLESILQQINRRCGVIGTVNYRVGDETFPSKNTTPGVLENQKLLKSLIDKNVDYCLMEVSSHALDQGRVDLIDFYAAIFTNLTQDHLDYHGTLENYFQAKAKLFTRLGKNDLAIINLDDPFGRRLKEMIQAKVISYGLDESFNVGISQLHTNINGSSFQAVTPWGNYSVETPLLGKHNVYNILAAIAFCLGEKIDPEDVFEGINHLRVIPGRLERIANHRGVHIFVDYAHTADGLRNVLEGLKTVAKARIITVFGCGGDRDHGKRSQMGEAASRYSDISIITTDNSRSEDPAAIAVQVASGFKGAPHTIILDRKEAILFALEQAKPEDIVLVAGKGHENYQIFKDRTVHFDDREVIREVLRETCSR